MDAGRSPLEYTALREAIAARGHLRHTLLVAGLGAWSLVLTVVLIHLPYPLAAIIPLTVLWGTFECVRALHFGAERIGRYLQVFYEEPGSAAGPAWETTAMALGAAVPGAAGHPLFASVFAVAIGVNVLAVVLPGPIAAELALMSVPHVALLVWVARVDRAMRTQRATDVARFRALRDGTPP